MSNYKVTVSREGKWWMVAIPEIEGLTQARRLSEVKHMAREYIAVTLDVPVESVTVTASLENVEGIPVSAIVESIEQERAQAAELERAASEKAQDLAKRLAEAQVPVRDIGAVMGVSHQRAHQLISH